MTSSRSLTVISGIAGVVVALVVLASVVLLPIGADPGSALPTASPTAVSIAPSGSTSEASQTTATYSPRNTPVPTDPPTIGLEVGQLAPDFELGTPDGKSIRLSNLRGHPVWVNFWAPWCPACRTEMPRIEAIWLEHQAAGLVVLGVGVRDSKESFQAYAAEVGVTYPLAMDLDGKVAELYRALALPVHYWLDSRGVVRDWAFGELPPDILEASIERILPLASATP